MPQRQPVRKSEGRRIGLGKPYRKRYTRRQQEKLENFQYMYLPESNFVDFLEALEQRFRDAQRRGFRNHLRNARLEYVSSMHELIEKAREQKLPVLAGSFEQQARFIAMLLDGASVKLAEMLALQSPPYLLTDAVFLQSHCNGNQFEGSELVGNAYKAQAQAAGVDVTGKVYLSGLAQYAGDPRAWVSGRGDVLRVARERGYTVDGAVCYRPPADVNPPPPDVDLDPALVEARVQEKLAQVPELAQVPQEELVEQTRSELKPPWAD